VQRRYYQCSQCQGYSFFADATLGLDATYTIGFERLLARCSGFWSYRLTAENLEMFTGIRLSPTTIGKLAEEIAGKLAVKLQDHLPIRQGFQAAKGETEFQTDGTSVNTRNEEGKAEWREMKVGVLAKRKRGESATPSEWETRELPKPTVVSAFAAIESKEEFLERCQNERRRVGVGGVSSALADGAKWIWSLVWTVFGFTAECLDIYHAVEHMASCGKLLYKDTVVFTEWLDRMRFVLLSEGFPGIERELSQILSGDLKTAERESVISLLKYFRGHSSRLNYAERLAQGRSIGSGLIEGACKNLVGRRLKQTGACWRVPRANRMAVLCSVIYSEQWRKAWGIP